MIELRFYLSSGANMGVVETMLDEAREEEGMEAHYDMEDGCVVLRAEKDYDPTFNFIDKIVVRRDV